MHGYSSFLNQINLLHFFRRHTPLFSGRNKHLHDEYVYIACSDECTSARERGSTYNDCWGDSGQNESK